MLNRDRIIADIAAKRERVARLRSEVQGVRTDIDYTQRGVETLTSYVFILFGGGGGGRVFGIIYSKILDFKFT